MRIIIAILIFSFIVIFHELGHFLVAKKCGIQVNEFSLGFGPRLLHFTKGETTYAWRLLPFGGACVMEGEDGDGDAKNPRAFNNKPVWQRFLVVFAGPFFNFLLAFILAVILIAMVGVNEPVVSQVMDGYPAQEAGLKAGDKIVKLNHYHVDFYTDVSMYVFFHTGENIHVTYERDGKTDTVTLKPKYDKEDKRYLLGLVGNNKYERTGIPGTVKGAFGEIKYYIYSTIQSLKMLVTGKVGIQDLSGPVGIVKVVGDTYEQASAMGAFYVVESMLEIAILLTANLGVMNLLPFPALDGGRLVFYIVEMIRRKPAPAKVEGAVNLVGFALLMTLMILVMISDISKLF